MSQIQIYPIHSENNILQVVGAKREMFYNFIDDINSVQQQRLIRCCGVVLSITKENNFFTFIINDNSGTAQASIYQPETVYKHLNLPQVNDSVVVMGHGMKKQFKGKQGSPYQLLKIKVLRFKIISVEEEFKILESAIDQKQNKLSKQKSQNPVQTVKLKTSIIKELRSQLDPIEIRTLILCCLYITLQNNIDLQSYTFSAYTIKKHRLTKNFLETKKLKEECTGFLEDFIEIGLKFLVERHILDKKDTLDGVQIYKVQRKLFNQIQLQTLSLINQKRNKGGATLGEVYKKINNQMSFYDENKFAFNQKLIQTILKKFIQQHKIYKTHDKMLLPNN